MGKDAIGVKLPQYPKTGKDSRESKIGCAIISAINFSLEETYMVDFMINLFAEIADFFITFWVDNVIDKFAPKISNRR